MTTLRNGKEWAAFCPGLEGDEPIMPNMQAWPSEAPPSLLGLMMAFSTYACSSCSVREVRMVAIYKMVRDGDYQSAARIDDNP